MLSGAASVFGLLQEGLERLPALEGPGSRVDLEAALAKQEGQ